MQDSKNILYKSLAILVIVLALLSVYCIFWGPYRDWGSSFVPARTFSVSASDKIDAVPDIAVLSLSMVTEGKDTTTILSDTNKKINDVIAFIKDNGISEKDIKTSQYNLYPVYSQALGDYGGIFTPSIQMYRATQSLSVKIRDFTKISNILNELSLFGINKINGISFQIEDNNRYIGEVRGSAFDKARKKAEEMAKQNGIKLGRIVTITDNSSPIFYGQNMLDSKSVGEESYAPSIEPGTKEISSHVSITYEIK